MVTLLAGTAQLAEARPHPGRPDYGNGGDHPGLVRPGPNRGDVIAARRAFDALNFAQHTAGNYNFQRTVRILQDANFELRGIRSVYTHQASRKVSAVIQQLNFVMSRRANRRIYQIESQRAINVIEYAKRDLINSGLLGRRW